MSAAKRARACDYCHSIKIKCELGSTGGEPPCERCIRLSKDCVVSPPKRQKDRIAELEAQVAALTKQLESSSIDSSVPQPIQSSQALDDQSSQEGLNPTQSAFVPLASSKKRRLQDDLSYANGVDAKFVANGSLPIDAILSKDWQRRIFWKYNEEIMPVCPLVPLAKDCDYDRLRKIRPTLLQAIVYGASPGMVSVETQEELAKMIMNMFASLAIAEGKKSVELVQAIHVAVLLYRAPKHHAHVAAFQLIQLAAGIAEDVGLGGPQSSPSLGFTHTEEDITSADGYRAWFVCHLFSSSMSIFLRRVNALSWTDYEELGVQMLAYSEYGLPSDHLLYQFIRAERLCERIATRLDFCNLSMCIDVSEPIIQLTMQGLQDSITDWKVQIPPASRCATLSFWEHAATLYLHESVLHTPTNKPSFAAPYLAERLSLTDFPIPVVTREHVKSLQTLRTTAHQLLDLFACLDVSTLMNLPSFLFAARIAYAQYILMKIYIAATAKGNTFGNFIDPESLKMEEYLDKIIRTAEMVKRIDPRCAQARILFSTTRVKEWFLNYNRTRMDQDSKLEETTGYAAVEQSMAPQQYYLTPEGDGFDDDILSFGLDDIFADPPMGWFADASQTNGYNMIDSMS